MYKTISGLILIKIKPIVNSKNIIGNYQCGFMVFGKSIKDHIFTVKQLVEKHYEFDKNLHNMLFLDYEQEIK